MDPESGRVAAVLLAAGASTRFGSPKMLASVAGEPLVRRVARSFGEAGFADVAVVVAPGSAPVAEALAGLGVLVVVNPRPADGMLSSARAGLAALPAGYARVALSPADVPGLTAPVLRRILRALSTVEPAAVAVPVSDGRRGHPLVVPASVVPRVLSWGAERKLSDLLREPDLPVRDLPGFGLEVVRDVDVPADLPASAP
jgi:molybdenum cofactor cytidylyltransferase